MPISSGWHGLRSVSCHHRPGLVTYGNHLQLGYVASKTKPVRWERVISYLFTPTYNQSTRVFARFLVPLSLRLFANISSLWPEPPSNLISWSVCEEKQISLKILKDGCPSLWKMSNIDRQKVIKSVKYPDSLGFIVLRKEASTRLSWLGLLTQLFSYLPYVIRNLAYLIYYAT